MPKITLTFTAKEIIEKFCNVDDLVDQIVEYAPDHGFPDSADLETIYYQEVDYTAGGDAKFTFAYDEWEEEEEEED